MSEKQTKAKEDPPPLPPPVPGGCEFYVIKKRRYCKFPPTNQQKFCVQHLPKNEAGEMELRGKKRVACPLDPHHSVFEHKLNSHLKKCSMNQRTHQGAFYNLEVNSGYLETPSEPESIVLADVDIERIKNLVERIRQIYQDNIQLVENIAEHEALREELSNPAHQKCLKHRKQEASLLGNLDQRGWVSDGTAYVEFGAGRARLTSYLLDTIPTHSKSKVLLIDRGATRNKCENRYKYLENGPSLERLRIDIKDLALYEHEVGKGTNQIVAYSKHLCGAATDLTLRCIQRVIDIQKDSGVSSRTEEGPDSKKIKLTVPRVKGIQIALCCHHRCAWVPYVGKPFWKSNKLSEEDFIITRTLSSWATCAFPDKEGEKGADSAHPAAPVIDKENRFVFWTSEEREQIGLMCKRIIDIGREHYLHSLGYDTQLVEYVKRETSLENVMLVAYPDKQKWQLDD